MEKAPAAGKEASSEQEKTKKTWGTKFLNFLMYGGFLVVLVLAVAIMILVSYLTK